MKRLVAIDPDTKESGLAFFVDGKLIDARSGAMAPAPGLVEHGAIDQLDNFLNGEDCAVVCEMPQHYGGKGDVRDFLEVARVVGRFEQIAYYASASFEAVPSKRWKGETPKEVCTLRVWEQLLYVEQAQVEILDGAKKRLDSGRGYSSGHVSDILDAIGIGLWKLGRLHEKRR